MFSAEVKEFPFAAELPKREKGRVARAWDLFVEYQAAIKEHGTLIPFSLAAKVLNVSRQRIGQLCETGQLKAIHCDNHPLVTEASLIAWARSERSQGGRPLKDPGMKEMWKASMEAGRELVGKPAKR